MTESKAVATRSGVRPLHFAQRLLRAWVPVIALFVGGAGTLVVGGCEQANAVSDGVFEAALAEAHAEGKLVVASFTANWCGPCKQMEATTWTDLSLQSWIEAHAVRVLVDIDRRGDLAREYGIRQIPASVVISDEREIGRLVGRRDASGVIEWLDGVRARHASSQGG